MARPTHHAKPATAMDSFLARLLDPVDRLVEGIYSVLIVLTFTLAFNVYQVQTEVGAQEVSAAIFQLFLAALGCAVAWGLIDGVMYILTSLFERGEQRRLFMAIRSAASEEEAVALLVAELDDKYAGIASAEERTRHCRDLYSRLKDLAPGAAGFKKEDFAGALGVALVAVLAALPVVLPLLLAPINSAFAVRLSNLAAFGMLYWMGYSWAKHVGAAPLKVGLLLLVIGIVMVSVAIPLGG